MFLVIFCDAMREICFSRSKLLQLISVDDPEIINNDKCMTEDTWN